MEWQQPAGAVRFYGIWDNFCVSPFSDRVLIDLMLKLPESYRFGPELRDALIAAADPDMPAVAYAAPVSKDDTDAVALPRAAE